MDAETALRELCAGWERLDAAGVAALFAPHGVYEGPLFESFPVGPEAVLANVNAGLLVILAITSIEVYGVIIAGWASNSKYAFLGALRASAQMVSYEIAIGF